MKIKLFVNGDHELLEDDVNDWLDNQENGTEIYGVNVSFSDGEYIALISYNEPDETILN